MEHKTIQTLSGVADAVNQKDVPFEIIILPQSRMQGWLQRVGLSPKKKQYSIRPIVLGNLIRISKLLLTIDPEVLKGKNFLDTSHEAVNAYGYTITEIIAIAIQNTKQEPSQKLIDLLSNNLTAAELMKLLTIVLVQMDLSSFISSIISIRGLNVLENGEQKKNGSEVSPKSQER